MYTYNFPMAAVTVDCVCLKFNTEHNAFNDILLIRRSKNTDAYPECLALPGGFLDVDMDESLEEAAIRELKEETNIELKPDDLIQVGAFGNSDRDPRMRTISVVFYACIDPEKAAHAKAGSDASDLIWANYHSITKDDMAFDHYEIICKTIDIFML